MRLAVQKTWKMYVGGKFIRSESGRVAASTTASGEPVNVPLGSRKDLRDAVGIARKAQPGWAGRTAYNRGQILYRLAEMLEGRELPTSAEDAAAAVDRAVHHAGWTDKIGALLSSINPVAGSYVNYSIVGPLGVVIALPDHSEGLLGLVEAVASPLVMGNAVIVLVPTESAELAVALGEAQHTSDVPAGSVALLTGDIDELLQTANTHDDVDGVLVFGEPPPTRRQAIDENGARVLRRICWRTSAATPATPYEFQQMAECKTVWMSSGIGGPRSGAAY